MEIGSWVVVRSSPSGVWLGQLLSREVTPDGLERVRLDKARKAWSWTGALCVSDLASRGPSGGKIAGPVRADVLQCCEVVEATASAIEAWSQVTPWTP